MADFSDHFMAVALTSAGDPLDVFGVDYTTFDVHGQLRVKVAKAWNPSEKQWDSNGIPTVPFP